MNRVTIVCPIALTCEYLTESAPIWVDAQGNKYRVASGIFDEPIAEATYDIKPADNTLQAVYGESGLDILAQMGLRAQGDDNEQTT